MSEEECYIRLGEMYYMKYGQNPDQKFRELTDEIKEEEKKIRFLEMKLLEPDKTSGYCFCTNCGNPIDATMFFCGQCGMRLKS